MATRPKTRRATTKVEVSLSPKHKKFVDVQIQSGRYQTSSEVVRDGLRLLQDRQDRLNQVRKHVQAGVDEARRGELLKSRDVFDEILRRKKKRKLNGN